MDDVTRNMVHELGHTIGLGHEHQRADAGEYVTLNCPALAGGIRGGDGGCS